MVGVVTYFKSVVPPYMKKFMEDFDCDEIDAAAVFGNLGHESGGFKSLQEKKPLVPGSRGGYGWAQWTGPRRVRYEKFCRDRNLNPASHDANYAYLFWELKYSSEKSAIVVLKKAKGLHAKVKAFEAKFERAGIKHYESRYAWADRALDAWRKSGLEKDKAPAKSIEAPPKPPTAPEVGGAIGGAISTGAAAWYSGLDWGLTALIAVVAAIAIVVIIRALKD